MPDPVLRDATRGDLPAVRELVFGVTAEYGFAPDPGGADRDLFDEADAYFGEGGMLQVLVDGGRVVGVVGVVPRPPDASELRKIYLARDHHGRGLGRLLLEAAVAFARARGSARLVLETSSKFTEALRLYERAGFLPAGDPTRSCHCDRSLELKLG